MALATRVIFETSEEPTFDLSNSKYTVSAVKGCSDAGVQSLESPIGRFLGSFPFSATGGGFTEIGFALSPIGFELSPMGPVGFSPLPYWPSRWPSMGVVLTGVFLQPTPALA